MAPGPAISPQDLLTTSTTVDTLTVNRIIRILQVVVKKTSEVEMMQIIDIGIGVSSLEAFNVGVTGLPDPQTQGDYPPRGWLYVSRRVVQQSLPTGGTPTAMWRQAAVFNFDLRAMRKIDKGVLFLVGFSTTVDGAASSVRLIGRVRALCLT